MPLRASRNELWDRMENRRIVAILGLLDDMGRNLHLAGIDNIAHTNPTRMLQRQADSQERRLAVLLAQERILRQSVSALKNNLFRWNEMGEAHVAKAGSARMASSTSSKYVMALARNF